MASTFTRPECPTVVTTPNFNGTLINLSELYTINPIDILRLCKEGQHWKLNWPNRRDATAHATSVHSQIILLQYLCREHGGANVHQRQITAVCDAPSLTSPPPSCEPCIMRTHITKDLWTVFAINLAISTQYSHTPFDVNRTEECQTWPERSDEPMRMKPSWVVQNSDGLGQRYKRNVCEFRSI